jgi:hypothetical protein
MVKMAIHMNINPKSPYTKIGSNEYEVDASPKAKYLGVRDRIQEICDKLREFSNDVADGNWSVRVRDMDLKVKIGYGFLTITDFREEGAFRHVDLNIYDF